MASTYENDLRLEEMATGENSGSWGTKTNTNLELVADAFSYGTEIIANADTAITIADGAADAARSLALKITSSENLTTTRVVTLGPNTTSKVWIIENSTSGGQTLTISAGSGSNITLANGTTKIIATDGIGAGSNVVELTQDLAIADMSVDGILKVDTINELTSAAGVTVEGVVLKDSDALFGNGEKAIFGDDLEIYHDGNAQIINAVGQINIDNNGDDKQINLRSDDGAGGITNYLRANGNTGAVQLYHYGSSKLATTTMGADIGTIGTSVSATLRLKTDGDNDALALNIEENSGTEGWGLGVNADGHLKFYNSGTGTSTGLSAVTFLDNDTVNFYSTSTTDQFVIENANTGAGSAPDIVLYRNSESPADGDVLGRMDFRGKTDSGTIRDYFTWYAEIEDATAASAFGSLNLQTSVGTTYATKLTILGDGKLGLGSTNPSTLLQLEAANNSSDVENALRFKDTDTAVVANQKIGRIEFETSDSSNAGVNLQIDAIYAGSGAGSELVIKTGIAGSLKNRLFIEDSETVFNDDGEDVDFRVEGASNKTHGLFYDSSLNQTFLGGSTSPTATGFLSLGGVKFSNGAATGGAFLSLDNEGSETEQSLLAYWYDGSNYKNRFRVAGNTTETTVNGSSDDIDFRVSSVGNANMLYVDAGLNRVGIGASGPSATLDVFSTETGSYAAIVDHGSSGNPNGLKVRYSNKGDTNTYAFVISNTDRDILDIRGTGSLYHNAYAGGAVVFNNGANAVNFQVKSDTNAQAIYLDGTTSALRLDVSGTVQTSRDAWLTGAQNQLEVGIVSQPSYESGVSYGGLKFRDNGWGSPVFSLAVSSNSGNGTEKGYGNYVDFVIKSSGSADNFKTPLALRPTSVITNATIYRGTASANSTYTYAELTHSHAGNDASNNADISFTIVFTNTSTTYDNAQIIIDAATSGNSSPASVGAVQIEVRQRSSALQVLSTTNPIYGDSLSVSTSQSGLTLTVNILSSGNSTFTVGARCRVLTGYYGLTSLTAANQ